MEKDEYKMSQQVDTTNYEEKYKQALSRAKDYINVHHTDVNLQNAADTMIKDLRKAMEE